MLDQPNPEIVPGCTAPYVLQELQIYPKEQGQTYWNNVQNAGIKCIQIEKRNLEQNVFEDANDF